MKKIALYLILVFAIIGSTDICKATCTELDIPVLKIELNELYLKLTWNEVENAKGYRLYYAPYPGKESWSVSDLGDILSLEAELWPGASYYLLIQAYNDCTESNNTSAQYFIAGKDLHYGLTYGHKQVIIEVKAGGMWHKKEGDVSPIPENTTFYLHSHLKNRISTCDNVLASAVVINGWLKFIFENPAELINLPNPNGSYILDKHWITNQYCTGGNSEYHLWIPELERNDLYVLNCDNNPELGIVYYEDEVTPVPPNTPCTLVGINCLD